MKKLIGKILQPIITQVYQYCFIYMLEFCPLFWSFYCVNAQKKRKTHELDALYLV